MEKNLLQGSNWKEYSKFEFLWVETILTKGLLSRDEMLRLLDSYQIKITMDNWREQASLEDMGNILVNDVPKKDLLENVKSLILIKHPESLSFEEAKKVHEMLTSLRDRQILRKLVLSTTKNQDLKEALLRDTATSSFSEDRIIGLILEGLYK